MTTIRPPAQPPSQRRPTKPADLPSAREQAARLPIAADRSTVREQAIRLPIAADQPTVKEQAAGIWADVGDPACALRMAPLVRHDPALARGGTRESGTTPCC
jgi:hypothetical protein